MNISKKKLAAIAVFALVLGLTFAPLFPDPNGTGSLVNFWQWTYRYLKVEMTVAKVTA